MDRNETLDFVATDEDKNVALTKTSLITGFIVGVSATVYAYNAINRRIYNRKSKKPKTEN